MAGSRSMVFTPSRCLSACGSSRVTQNLTRSLIHTPSPHPLGVQLGRSILNKSMITPLGRSSVKNGKSPFPELFHTFPMKNSSSGSPVQTTNTKHASSLVETRWLIVSFPDSVVLIFRTLRRCVHVIWHSFQISEPNNTPH